MVDTTIEKSDILIVDDSPANLKSLSSLLSSEGWHIRIANDGASAIEAFNTRPPDLILLDIRMPGMDGYDVCKLIRTQDSGLELPIIFISVAEDTESIVEGFAAGGSDYITKPFRAEELIARVRTHLRLQGHQKHLEMLVSQRTREIVESELKFRQVTENIDEVFWLVDIEDMKILYLSPSYERVWGTPLDTASIEAWRNSLHPEDQQAYADLLQTSEKTREYRIVRGDGKVRWIRHRVFPVTGTAYVRRIAAIAEDVTDSRESQQRLLQSEKMASLGMTISGVAHEINSPNSVNMVNADILTRIWPDITTILDERERELGELRLGGLLYEETREHLAGIGQRLVSSSRRIKRIVQDLRDYSLTSDSAEYVAVDIKFVVETVVRLLAPDLVRSGVELVTKISDFIPAVLGDPHRLEQVIINLINNAVQACEVDGHIVIEADWGRGNSYLDLLVTDNGQGISADDLPYVMEPFFTKKRTHGGTGLGLAICDSIIRHHGGGMTVNSERGKGTTICVSLPVHLVNS